VHKQIVSSDNIVIGTVVSESKNNFCKVVSSHHAWPGDALQSNAFSIMPDHYYRAIKFIT